MFEHDRLLFILLLVQGGSMEMFQLLLSLITHSFIYIQATQEALTMIVETPLC